MSWRTVAYLLGIVAAIVLGWVVHDATDSGDLVKWTNDHAAAIQALAAIAALVVAGVAAWIARGAREAEDRQAAVAHEALQAATVSDRLRRRDEQILAAPPLLLTWPEIDYNPQGEELAGSTVAYVEAPAVRTSVLDLKVVVRRDDSPVLASAGGISLVEGQALRGLIVLDPIYKLAFETNGRWNVHVEWRGPLNQRVIEDYEWTLGEVLRRSDEAWAWGLTRFQVVPSVPGADGFEMRFDPPGT
ncbi:MAG: hypothetical protein QOJ81_1682 [Chloroflexota bacterium]|jgi:hypothetical protein|nr:hypothetical protein [Chloroflexota bacterium]